LQRMRRVRPSPALVIACLALFVALGGTVLAATKIDGHKIKPKSLPGNRLEPGSLAGNRLEPGTIKGSQIDATTLGQVPSAAHASSADTAHHADTATAADHATDATTINGRSVGCPEGKREFAGACWDAQLRSAQLTLPEASALCGGEGGELPTAVSLLAFNGLPGIAPDTGGEWTTEVRVETTGYYSPIIVEGTGSMRPESAFARLHFRCVTPLVH
jgi:hypothetical protein